MSGTSVLIQGKNAAATGLGNTKTLAVNADGAFTSGYRCALSTTRPANTTPYNAGDVVGGVLTFTNMGPDAGHVLLTTATLEIDVTAIPAGMTSFRLHLYSATPGSAIADNSAWDLPSGDRASYLGYIDLGSPADLGSTLFTQLDNVNKQIKLASGATSIYGYLVTAAGYTPAANSEVYVTTLHGIGV